MKKKNLLVGIAIGAAALSVALLLKKNSKYNLKSLYGSAGDAIDAIRGRVSGENSNYQGSLHSDSPGRHLANKARHKAEHHLAMNKNSN